ncbi:MAG: hypothetical protein LLG42_09385 [Chloroflexi bacterium]|nr:hypothetical protein [Chloroflexota bacterium]
MLSEEDSSTAQKRILILTADAGFGHRSAARAISAALQELHPVNCDVQIVNPLHDKRVPSILRNSGEDYDRLIKKMPSLYKFEYEVSDSAPTSAMVNSALAVILFEVNDDC